MEVEDLKSIDRFLAQPGLQPPLPVVGGVEGIESVPSKGQGRVMCGEQNAPVTSLPRLCL